MFFHHGWWLWVTLLFLPLVPAPMNGWYYLPVRVCHEALSMAYAGGTQLILAPSWMSACATWQASEIASHYRRYLPSSFSVEVVEVVKWSSIEEIYRYDDTAGVVWQRLSQSVSGPVRYFAFLVHTEPLAIPNATAYPCLEASVYYNGDGGYCIGNGKWLVARDPSWSTWD